MSAPAKEAIREALRMAEGHLSLLRYRAEYSRTAGVPADWELDKTITDARAALASLDSLVVLTGEEADECHWFIRYLALECKRAPEEHNRSLMRVLGLLPSIEDTALLSGSERAGE